MQAELKKRVDERLNTTPKKQAANVAANIAPIDSNFDELLEFNDSDTEHLLWEEITGLVYLTREVDSALISDEATGANIGRSGFNQTQIIEIRKNGRIGDYLKLKTLSKNFWQVDAFSNGNTSIQ